jgi:hypothetical protein
VTLEVSEETCRIAAMPVRPIEGHRTVRIAQGKTKAPKHA